MSGRIELPELGLYRLKREDIDKAVEVLTEAFDEDPFLLYLLDSNYYDKVQARHIHRFNLEYGIRYGYVLAVSQDLEGIMIWLPPNETEMSIWKIIRSGAISVKMKTHKNIFKQFNRFNTLASELHRKFAPFPHWYLMVLAVDKKLQGRHLASKLLNPVLGHFDKANYPCYLETHNVQNIVKYEHYGFKIAETCLLPDSNKNHWSMIRIPLRKREINYA